MLKKEEKTCVFWYNRDENPYLADQVINQKNMEKRTLYYWIRMYQLKRGQKYEELNRAITINRLNYELLPQETVHTMYGIYVVKAGHRLTEDLEIHFLEIPKHKAKHIKK